MMKRNELSSAIAVALATSTGLISGVVAAEEKILEEVTVTATKRAENLQDVPFAVSALGQEKLDELNIANFDDYIRYLPGVNAAGRGPGQSSIFIRGMATDSSDQTSIEIGAPVPNVALYLDEQPVSSGGRNLDLYAADIARVEVLPGPQGTLFGASSQAGTIRLITNKPVYNEFQAGFKASIATTKSGDLSNSVETYINWPVIDDTLAIRGVFYNAVEGGYIDNVFGENSYTAEDVGFPEGAESTVVNNIQFVENDFNDAVYTGGRVSVNWAINDDWELLGQYMAQTLDVDGVFDHSPESINDIPNVQAGRRVVGDLQVQRFFPDYLDDEFQRFGLTVNGRLGALDLVYAGSYLDREVNNSFDYSGYTQVGNYGYYYLCQPEYTLCGDPTQGVIAYITNERTTHELRISSSEGERVNFVAGVFYDDITTKVDTNFYVAASTGYFAPNRPLAGSTQNNPDFRPQGITFINDAIREEEQIAFFGEVTFDLTDQWSVTAGARYYDLESSLLGSSSFANVCDFSMPCDESQDGEGGRNFDEIFAPFLPLKESDTILKGVVSWRPVDDTLFYVLYSEGFRPGGFNRIDSDEVPKTYISDEVTNYEFGWKSTLLGGTLRFNGSIYRIDWDGLQVGITDFNISVITFTTNAADAEITGFEGDLTWLATDSLTLSGAWSLNDTEMVRVPPAVSDIAGVGSRLALAPEFQYNVSARYEWLESELNPYAQVVYAYTSDQYSSIVVDNRFLQQSYNTLDASFGLNLGNWSVELFGENLTDERAQLFINSLDTDLRITTNRPRTFGLKVRYDYF
jgi:outer membrane receptor protein involved in Fe transport